jgi:UDP-galactopyranose mutase
MRRRLLDKLLAKIGDRPLICWYYTPMALPFADHLAPAVTVYDCMDELSAFRGAPRPISLLERELFAKADVVFTGGRSLYELKRSQHRNVHCFPSSIDAEHFARARKIDEPDPGDQASIPRPRFGFFGVVDERMDLELVRRLAELQPDWQLVMIGPVVKIDAAELPRARNIHWLGSKKYEELPSYLSGWNAGIMPFALNEATRFISPTKTPEFLAAGLPVVSKPIRDVVRLYGNAGFVEIAGSAEDFVSKLKILLDRPRAEWRARVDDHLRSTSWDKTWAGMHARIRPALASRRTPSLAEARTSLTAAAEVARV